MQDVIPHRVPRVAFKPGATEVRARTNIRVTKFLFDI